MVSAVNRLNRAYTETFVENMNLLKPTDKKDALYAQKYRAWQSAFAFTNNLKNIVNDFNNQFVLKGKPNKSK